MITDQPSLLMLYWGLICILAVVLPSYGGRLHIDGVGYLVVGQGGMEQSVKTTGIHFWSNMKLGLLGEKQVNKMQRKLEAEYSYVFDKHDLRQHLKGSVQ